MSDKDYSLLRPFDLEAAKRGEVFYLDCGRDTEKEKRKYIAGPDCEDRICVQYESGRLDVGNIGNYLMAPLCWVEGKPVYVGDVLYRKHLIGKCFVRGLDGEYLRLAAALDLPWGLNRPEDCTWQAHKVKREGWVVVGKDDRNGCSMHPGGVKALPFLYTSEAKAREAWSDAVACVRIEWEEPSNAGS